MEYAYQNSTIAQILEAIINESTFEGESNSNIGDILLSILNKTPYTEPPKSVIADLLLRVKAKIEGESFDPYEGDHISRIADILISILNETEYTEEPQSRIAELLLELKEELEAYTELTASGSIASFITNVVKPLVNGEFTIQAYQEGSGDPAPDNVRNIIPFNTQKITKASGNLLKMGGRVYADPSAINFSNTTPRTFEPNSYCYCLIYTNYCNRAWMANIINISLFEGGFQCESTVEGNQAYSTMCFPILDLKIGATYSLSATFTNCVANISFYKADGTYISGSTNANNFVIPNETKYTVVIFKANEKGVFKVENVILSVGSQATAYEPYIEPEIKTVALGEDVYGGSYNSVSGVMIDNSDYFVLDGSENWSVHSSGAFMITLPGTNIPYSDRKSKCNYFKWVDKYTTAMLTGEYKNVGSIFYFADTDINSLDDWKSWLNTHNIQLVTSKINSDEVQLEPTPINTFNGANNIFCDTGDSSVTYLYKGTPPETVTRLLSKGVGENNDIMKEEIKTEDEKPINEEVNENEK